jgi:hypothetical protein
MVLPYLLLVEVVLLAILFPALSIRPAAALWSVLTLAAIPLAIYVAYRGWAAAGGSPTLAWIGVFGLPVLIYAWVRGAGHYRHARVSGARDPRYRDNPWVPAFPENSRGTAGSGHIGNLLGGGAAILFVVLSEPVAPEPAPPVFPVTVTATAADAAQVKTTCYLRTQPRQDGEVVATLSPGAPLAVIERLGMWWQVVAREQRGWIHRSCVKPTGADGRR